MRLLKKIISHMLIAVLILSSANCVYAQESVCVLSDFEKGLDGWNNDFESTMYRTNEEAHSGNFSMETTVMNDYGCPKYHFRFIPGVKYKFSVWVKTKSGPDVAQVIFDYSAYGQQQPYWGFFGMNTSVSSDEWTEISFEYTYNGGNPTGDTNIFVRFGDGLVEDLSSEERKTYYIDDMKISYQNPDYSYVDTVKSKDETAVNMGFDLNTDGYYTNNARMKHVPDGCNNTYGAALVMTDGNDGYVGQKYTVEEGKRYELSAYVKSPDKELPFRYMVAERVDGVYTSRPLSDEIVVGDEWTKLTAAYNVRDDGYSKEKIFYILGGNGREQIKYYLDEFSILKLDAEEEAEYVERNKHFTNPGGRLVINAGGGNITDAEPYFQNQELMCRADKLAEAIGAEYGYSSDGAFYLKKGVNTLRIFAGSKAAYFNSIVKLQKNMPVCNGGRLMISADFVADEFGIDTEFLTEYNIFYIKNEAMSAALANTVRKINKNEKLKIAYFGSSFTRGGDTDYPVVKPLKKRILEWFGENFPYVEAELIDAETNGTDSTLGAYRLDEDVLAYSPDLVFIDFSVQDYETNNPSKTAKNLENAIRRIKENSIDTDIVVLSSMSEKIAAEYSGWRQPFTAKLSKDIAGYYDVAFVDLGKVLYEDYEQSGAALTDYFIKSMQPTEKAVGVYMNELAEFLEKSIKNNNNLYSCRLKNSIYGRHDIFGIIGAEAATTDDGWRLEEKSIPDVHNAYTVSSVGAGDELSVNFTGTSIGVMWQVSPKSGAVWYKIDDGKWIYLDAYDENAYKYARLSYEILGENLENTEHTLTLRTAEKANPKSMGNEIVIGGFLEKRTGV